MKQNRMSLIGEATAYDKKQQLEVKRPKSWLKSVSAFANGETQDSVRVHHIQEVVVTSRLISR